MSINKKQAQKMIMEQDIAIQEKVIIDSLDSVAGQARSDCDNYIGSVVDIDSYQHKVEAIHEAQHKIEVLKACLAMLETED